ncbi:MAG: hypothetical protein EXR81_01805 [Gammaproteobacteria bacterium]|nr:hypothetical protein [Gammaproteobacteria bacterium]
MKNIGTHIIYLLLVFTVSLVHAETQSDFFQKKSPAIKSFLQKSQPLTEKSLKKLIVENTVIGHTCHTNSIYELLFEKNGSLIFRKSRDKNQIYIGKWWVRGNHIFSQWNHYLKKPTVNELEYHHLMGNIYVPYNVNEACGPAGTYGVPFMVFKGDPFGLRGSIEHVH